MIDSSEITVTFKDVGGISEMKAELWDLVVLPLKRPDLFRSQTNNNTSDLLTAPRGILLFGAPGTGKTMLAKAIANESNATFCNLRLSTIMNQYLGESNKLVAATFSLAQKLAPSIIFIDEIDTFLRQRTGGSNDSSMGSIKSEFLTLWDGISTGQSGSGHVLVLGATNRPYDIDSAILRRLPRTFNIGLPPPKSRLAILKLLLKKQAMTVEARGFVEELSSEEYTEGYSGSDLKELCRAAAMQPIRELTAECSRRAVNDLGNSDRALRALGPPRGVTVRAVTVEDLKEALTKVKRTGEAAEQFRQKGSH